MNELSELESLRAEIRGAAPGELPRATEALASQIRAAEAAPQRPAARDRRPLTSRRPASRAQYPGPWRPVLGGTAALGLRRPALAGAAALGLAVAVAATAIVTRAGGTAPGNPGRAIPAVLTAAEVLNRAADAAAAAPLADPGPDQFIYSTSFGTDTVSEDLGDGRGRTWQMGQETRSWQSVSGYRSGLEHTDVTGDKAYPWGPPPPRDAPAGASWDTLPALACPGSPPPRRSYQFLTTLPTQPGALRNWLLSHKNGGQGAQAQLWADIGDMMGDTLVPPKLAAALFKVAATVPGTQVIKQVRDAIGRPGIAVALQGPKGQGEMIFDPHSYRLLGERTVLTSPEKGIGPAGTIVSESAFQGFKVVSKLPRISGHTGAGQLDRC